MIANEATIQNEVQMKNMKEIIDNHMTFNYETNKHHLSRQQNIITMHIKTSRTDAG